MIHSHALTWVATRRPAILFVGVFVIGLLATARPARAVDRPPQGPPPWLDADRSIQVGVDGVARSIYQPEFRPAPWLREQLAQQGLAEVRADLVTPLVSVPRAAGAKVDPPPVPGRILLTGPPERVRDARALLRRFDLAPRAILVSMLITEVARRTHSGTGGSILFDKAGAADPDRALFRSFGTAFEPDAFLRGALSGATPYEGTTLVFGNDDVGGSGFEYALRMLQKEGEAEFLAWPNLLINEGEPASLAVTGTVPQWLLVDSADGSVSRTDELTGLRLRVTPRTIGGEHAVLDLDLWLRLPEPVTGPDVTPGTIALKVRQVTTRITVRDREPLMIGGIVLRHKRGERRGLPRPRQIAALDPLHSSRIRDAAETEIVFLVRTRLVPPGRAPAELDPATFRAWTTGRRLPDPWADTRDAGGTGAAARAARVAR